MESAKELELHAESQEIHKKIPTYAYIQLSKRKYAILKLDGFAYIEHGAVNVPHYAIVEQGTYTEMMAGLTRLVAGTPQERTRAHG